MFDAVQGWCQHLFWWVNWDAVEAVGTVAALFFAITIAGRQSRDERRRDAARLKVLMTPLATVQAVVRQALRNDERAKAAEHILRSKVIEVAQRQLDKIDPMTLPSSLAVEILGRSPEVLERLKAALRDIALGNRTEVDAVKINLDHVQGELRLLGPIVAAMDPVLTRSDHQLLSNYISRSSGRRQRVAEIILDIASQAVRLVSPL